MAVNEASTDEHVTQWIEWIEEHIKRSHIKYYKYEGFNKIEEIGVGLVGKVYKANWKQSGTCVALKLLNLNNYHISKEIIYEVELHRGIGFNNFMINLFGITKTNLDEYLLVTEYAEGGTLRNYLKENFSSLNWGDKFRLAFQLSSAVEYIHEIGIIHKDLHPRNIFIRQNSIKLADFGLNKRVKDTSNASFDSFDAIPYIDPKGFDIVNSPEGKRINNYELNEKSDIYSIGVLLWELSSGKEPLVGKEYNLSLITEIKQGLRESIVEGTPEDYSNLYAKCWDDDPGKRPIIREIVTTLKSMMYKINLIQRLKFNHGLFLDGCSIQPSKQAIFVKDSKLNASLYKGQPLVYTFINDRNSHTNSLSFNSNDSNLELNEALQPSDVCINFPFVEITYNTDLLESFSNFTGDEEALYEAYGHLFARKVLLGGKLFIDDLTSFNSTQLDSFKSLLHWAYDSAKYNKTNPFSNLSSVDFFPKITTLDGERIDTSEKLINWMNNLYKKQMVGVVSYNNIIPISQLKSVTSSKDTLYDKQPGVANFKEKLDLKDWVGDSKYVNLPKWTKEFSLSQGLMISKHRELERSKKVSIEFVNIPDVDSSNKFYLKMIKPATNMEEFLISNNISLENPLSVIEGLVESSDVDSGEKSGLEMIKLTNSENSLSTVKKSIKSDDIKNEMDSVKPYMNSIIKNAITSKDLNNGDYTYFIINFKQYKIVSTRDDIKSSEKFKQDIEKAIESMKPLTSLDEVFDEYGHFFPLIIVLGKSLKNILPSSSITNISEDLENIESSTFESLQSHLDSLNISHLLTQKGDIIKKEEIFNWIQRADNDLEIIENEKIIYLHEVLEQEQQKKIRNILDIQHDHKIIMTGVVDLKDLDKNNTEHFKRIDVEPSLGGRDYEVFGSIISKENSKQDNFFVTFGLYDFNGFAAMISKLSETSVDIRECYILWTIIGKPSQLSVFSPKNRNCKVNYLKETVVLEPKQSKKTIKIPFALSPKCTITFNSHTKNFEIKNYIKLIKWSNNSIEIEIIKPIIEESATAEESDNKPTEESDKLDDTDNSDYFVASTDIELAVCVMSSDIKSLKIDNDSRDSEYPLDLIGISLTENTFSKVDPPTKLIVPIAKFLPLISEIGNILETIIDIAQAAEHNKRICNALKQRVYAVELAVLDLKVQRNNQKFFNINSFLCLQDLVDVIMRMKMFVEKISQMKQLLKLKSVQSAENIEKTFKELCRDFDKCIIKIDISSFTDMVKSNIRPGEEIEDLKADQDELNKHLEQIVKEVREDVKALRNEYDELSSVVTKINAMNSTMEKFMDKQERVENVNSRQIELYQSKIDEIFIVNRLEISDYKNTDERRKDGRVTKWIKIGNKNEEFAFKIVSEEKNSVKNQVTILKQLHDFQNIIKIYGLAFDGVKWYLVIEWAEYGNLREFYTDHKDKFDLESKLRIALDISRGLNALRTVEIVHRDVRAENVLITSKRTAKLANFKLSRSLNAHSLKQNDNLERIRYCAPELLERAPDFKYDYKCEVYSFGVLLWEIAEEKTPYEDHNDLVTITDIVRTSKKREPFSENSKMPKKFKDLSIRAVNYDPEFRPKVTTMFDVLNDCYESFIKPSHARSKSASLDLSSQHDASQNLTPENCHTPLDLESFKYMTLAEAEKQHKLVDRSGRSVGDTKTAYKCFEAYANFNRTNRSNQIKAKYFKAYYISKRLDDLKINSGEKDEIAAKLFKEVADDEANEFPEAKLKYGDCLYHGKGVKQNLPEALKYFELAAKNGFKVAMYNTGKLYYNGCNGLIGKNEEKAIKYMKLAVYHEYDHAMEFCKDHNIEL